ncbi:MAG: indolepyruvate oxidoreductase [Deltaproteobacteria bacterium]|nr:indolepyruvate oxidoreductase [Deltaproteobacteria bacterium]
MGKATIDFDPFNLIITGVGGQGNVMASRVVGNMIIEKGFHVTIGETFGASQRGGSVMSHLRISTDSGFSPQIPKGRAHMVIALEPTEALRVLKDYGNPSVYVLCNMRPIQFVAVICGDQPYPALDTIIQSIRELSKQAWFLNTTDAALKLGNPILGNIMIVGALVATGLLPLDRDSFKAAIGRVVSPEKAKVNLAAFEQGLTMLRT